MTPLLAIDTGVAEELERVRFVMKGGVVVRNDF